MAVRPGSHIRNPQRDPRTAKVSTNVSSWLNFTPASLNPQLWLDASDTITITESGGSVSQWNDKSGNSSDAVQATGARQPTSGSATLNGLNVLSFDGGDFMTIGTTNLARNVVGTTVYVMYKNSTDPTTLRIPIRISTGGDGAALRITVDVGATSQKLRTGGRTLDANAIVNVTGSATISTSWLVQTSVYDYANTDLFLYFNSVEDGSTTSFQTATTTSNTASTRTRIGSDLAPTPTAFLTGELAEILVFHDAHTAGQRQVVWQYLASKWGPTY